MILRLLVTTGVFAFGYYLGREVGRQTPVRRELDAARSRGEYREVDASAPENETVVEPMEPDSESQS